MEKTTKLECDCSNSTNREELEHLHSHFKDSPMRCQEKMDLEHLHSKSPV